MFRGEAPVKADTAVTSADMQAGNLILWGDPSSNAVLARIAARLPIRWDRDGTILAGGKTYPAGTSVPVFLYPNPLAPSHYVVVNSAGCGALLKPKPGDCCVYCSYGDVACPPIQEGGGKGCCG